jgi:hypothetical protein
LYISVHEPAGPSACFILIFHIYLHFAIKKKQKEEAFDLESENSLARQINSTPTSNEIWMCSPIDFCCQLFQPLSILFTR